MATLSLTRTVFSCLLVVILLVTAPGQIQAQETLQNKKEEVYLHVNSAELVVGETLLFSAFVRSSLTGKLSTMSRILYVELLDATGKSVWQSKILLEDGRGAGDLFLSSLFNTGNYHLVAYTQWMKNFNDFYDQEVIIYNPFEYYKPSKEGKGAPKIDFYPESGFFHADRENRLIVKGYFPDGTPFQTKGRIVNAAGDNLLNFELGAYGMGEIKFSPQSGESYRIIVESETGEFLFFDLPDACSDCPLLLVESRKNDFLVQLKKGDLPVWLEVVDNQNRYFSRTIEDNESFTVLRSKLPKGYAQIKLWTANRSQLISSRNILNSPFKSQDVQGVRTYGKRIKLEETFDLGEKATVSVSVNKVYDNNVAAYDLVNDHGANQFLSNYPRKAVGNADLTDMLLITANPEVKPLSPSFVPKYLPEHRSDQIHGEISQEPGYTDRVVAAAVMNGQLELIKPQADGKLTLNLHPEKEGTQVLAKLAGDNQDAQLTWESEFYESYPTLTNTPLNLDSTKVADLSERSIKNQVQNVYYAFRPDSSFAVKRPFEDQFIPIKSYRLDDFTRFPTMRDTFIEYVEEVAVSKNENNFDLRVRLWDSALDHPTDTTELILVDGVPFSSQEILELSPYAVSKIHVIPNHFYLGEVTAKGVLHLETLERDMEGLNYQQYDLNYVGVQGRKKYRQTDHTDVCEEPDYRDQLLWMPTVDAGEGKLEFDFFTSDISGTYQIRIEGITASGAPVSIKKSFIVE